MAFLHRRNFLGRAASDDRAAPLTTLGPKVDDMIRAFDHVEIMLDNQHRVPRIDKALQDDQKLPDILEVKARCRLIEDVEGFARLASMKLACQFDPLRFAPGKGGRRLTEAHVSKPHIEKRLQFTLDRRDVLEERKRLLDGHIQDIGDVLSPISDLKRLSIVPRAPAHLARDVDIG